ncbi:Short-chain dehydrogenase/reductase tropG [Lachnellula suecica]|uniref:Short-chain dehydrogenase/reductase tropG n=1 Tax=Lachnellula suecica TaxID=602035 RepID=A0A8T9CDN3_9HELO|nr:Short-chain dehydrogenase/reductase tropG [Lachnellula suecica]
MGLAGDILQMNVGQMLQTPVLPSTDFTGKTIIITGANQGLGFEAAKHLLVISIPDPLKVADRDYHSYQLNAANLILACRNLTKGEEARKAILASGRHSSPGKIEVWQLDMSKYSSVLAFGDRINSLPRLDVLIANAGMNTTQFERLEGHESTITVNVISTILLATLTVPKLRETSKLSHAPSRLVITGSAVHIFADHKCLSTPKQGQVFKTLDDEPTADMTDRYYLSKLVLLLAYRGLAKELDHSSEKGSKAVVLNFVNPGWCKTELFRTADGGLGARIGLCLVGRAAEEGSRTLVHAAAVGEEAHGKYLSECRVKPESTWARSQQGVEVEKGVWAELVDILEGIRPGVTKF